MEAFSGSMGHSQMGFGEATFKTGESNHGSREVMGRLDSREVSSQRSGNQNGKEPN